jgi:Ca-activated chloride channel family protein
MWQLFQPFHFLRPYWLIALIPLAIIIMLLWKQARIGSYWRQVVEQHLLTDLLVGTAKRRQIWPFALLALAWLIAIFALAGPTWSKRPQPVYQQQNAKVIVFDLSTSMLTQDIQPTRLKRAKYKVRDILNQYSQGQTGMVVFSRAAFVGLPLTTDTHTIATLVPQLRPQIMPVQGSRIAAGLGKAKQLLQQARMRSGHIILITDSKPKDAGFHEVQQL